MKNDNYLINIQLPNITVLGSGKRNTDDAIKGINKRLQAAIAFQNGWKKVPMRLIKKNDPYRKLLYYNNPDGMYYVDKNGYYVSPEKWEQARKQFVSNGLIDDSFYYNQISNGNMPLTSLYSLKKGGRIKKYLSGGPMLDTPAHNWTNKYVLLYTDPTRERTYVRFIDAMNSNFPLLTYSDDRYYDYGIRETNPDLIHKGTLDERQHVPIGATIGGQPVDPETTYLPIDLYGRVINTTANGIILNGKDMIPILDSWTYLPNLGWTDLSTSLNSGQIEDLDKINIAELSRRYLTEVMGYLHAWRLNDDDAIRLAQSVPSPIRAISGPAGVAAAAATYGPYIVPAMLLYAAEEAAKNAYEGNYDRAALEALGVVAPEAGLLLSKGANTVYRAVMSENAPQIITKGIGAVGTALALSSADTAEEVRSLSNKKVITPDILTDNDYTLAEIHEELNRLGYEVVLIGDGDNRQYLIRGKQTVGGGFPKWGKAAAGHAIGTTTYALAEIPWGDLHINRLWFLNLAEKWRNLKPWKRHMTKLGVSLIIPTIYDISLALEDGSSGGETQTIGQRAKVLIDYLNNRATSKEGNGKFFHHAVSPSTMKPQLRSGSTYVGYESNGPDSIGVLEDAAVQNDSTNTEQDDGEEENLATSEDEE